ncbi:MAG: TonB-dependent vitamin B12 receptor [Gallionella sp.]|jgi:vitamin B12 transporter|nr:TonB-dependent vitamin B12 receptor [Gallionella sp.]MCK9355312.1 TonB-dependent vitamin B12 receptor [Gallionella sp.]
MKQKQLLAALLYAVTPLAYAETTGIMDEVLVTATRTAQSVDATLASVTVITRQDIERRQAQSLPDALRGVPGLTISNSGGAGKATAVYLRGTNADHVLVLVDGVKVGSATTGTASFQDIPVAQIERIEIVRGPRASLYGSEAIGGVIQIFTRKGGGALMPSFSATAGSYGTANATLGLSGGGEQGWFSANLNQQEIGGFNACSGKPAPGAAGCRVTEPDKDGYRNSSLGLRGGYRFDNGVTAGFNALQADSFSKSDGSIFAGNETRAAQQALGGSLKFAPLQAWSVTLRGGRSRDDSDLYFNGLYIDRYNTKRDILSWQNDFALGADQMLTAGLDYQQDHVESSRAFAQTARRNRALFGQYLGDFGAHSLQASLRRDDNQQFGGHNTGGLSYGYAIGDAARLTASYGTAFKAPTFNQLYYPGFGSATLRPELSRSIEAGVDGRGAFGGWSLHAYQTDISSLIGFDAVTFAPVNINTARLQGLEAQLQTRMYGWEANGTLTLQDPRQTSGANSGKLLNRRASEATRIEAAHEFGAYRLTGALYAEGRRFDDLANTKRLGGYGLLDVRAEYRVDADWLLQGRIENLLDKRYETAQYFNQPGRGLYFTLNYQPRN